VTHYVTCPKIAQEFSDLYRGSLEVHEAGVGRRWSAPDIEAAAALMLDMSVASRDDCTRLLASLPKLTMESVKRDWDHIDQADRKAQNIGRPRGQSRRPHESRGNDSCVQAALALPPAVLRLLRANKSGAV
jgi:hypothetical protein